MVTDNTNTNANDANFNKRQFWTYKKLNEHGKSYTKHNTKSSNTSSTSNTSNTSNTSKTKIIKSKKKQFHLVNNKIATDKTLIKRLESIYIPPAYKDIVIAKSPHNKIQAIGTDLRGRRQYVYNHKFTKKRNDRKYDFLLPLGKNIIKIEQDNEAALNTLSSKPYNNWSLPDDYIPIIIYMLRTYHFRIGNEKYTNDNNSYGITTLKKEHIKFANSNTSNTSNTKFTISFIGKKGILNTYTDNNPKSNIVKILKTLIANASPDGFIFKYNYEGSKQFITPEHIHSFFQTKYNSEITPKMFRTWYGNFHMLEHLRELYNQGKLKPRMTKSEVNSIVKEFSEHVSSKLNNTPTVSKQSYIDNKILDLVIKNPYRFASKIPDNSNEQHKYLYQIIMKLRNL